MSATDELLANAENYAASFTKGEPPRGFVYDVHNGTLREVS